MATTLKNFVSQWKALTADFDKHVSQMEDLLATGVVTEPVVQKTLTEISSGLRQLIGKRAPSSRNTAVTITGCDDAVINEDNDDVVVDGGSGSRKRLTTTSDEAAVVAKTVPPAAKKAKKMNKTIAALTAAAAAGASEDNDGVDLTASLATKTAAGISKKHQPIPKSTVVISAAAADPSLPAGAVCQEKLKKGDVCSKAAKKLIDGCTYCEFHARRKKDVVAEDATITDAAVIGGSVSEDVVAAETKKGKQKKVPAATTTTTVITSAAAASSSTAAAVVIKKEDEEMADATTTSVTDKLFENAAKLEEREVQGVERNSYKVLIKVGKQPPKEYVVTCDENLILMEEDGLSNAYGRINDEEVARAASESYETKNIATLVPTKAIVADSLFLKICEEFDLKPTPIV
jgi:hypothetical protein